MTLTLDSTVGGANANAYGSVADISTYAATTVWATNWTALEDTEDAQSALAIRAARVLDTMAFSGYPSSTTQALAFPRIGVILPIGYALDSETVPPAIVRAWAHIACWLSSFDATVDPFSVDDTAKIAKLAVGPIAMDFRPSMGPDGALFLATVIAPMLRPFGLLGAGGAVRLVR